MPLRKKTVLITGADGFIGRNLSVSLEQTGAVDIISIDVNHSMEELLNGLKRADFVFHLAGINRPKNIEDFKKGNTLFTKQLVDLIETQCRAIPIAFTSSIQAGMDNEYGRSKRKAEQLLVEYAKKNKAELYIFRLPNVFGKWCRPNYNSVVATFCHNIAHGQKITVHDENTMMSLVYIDTVTGALIKLLKDKRQGCIPSEYYCEIDEVYNISVGDLAHIIRHFREFRAKAIVPDMGNSLSRYLYSTYLSYVDPHELSVPLTVRSDERGRLVEIIKSDQAGQMFFSTSNAGVIRGNHYHNTKVEKFCVVQGKARIKLKHILSGEVITYDVSGEDIAIVDIPPGYTHSLTNTGGEQLITLFWANEMFDHDRPDTYSLEA